MTQPELGPISDQLELLRLRGEQFTAEEKEAARAILPGVFMESDGEPALYDTRIIPHIPSMVVPDLAVCRALQDVRGERPTTQNAAPLIDKLMSAPGLVIGFSGYGTEGKSYDSESFSIQMVFNGAEEAGLPIDFVVDGGTGYGVPGLSGAWATMYEYPTVGYAPLYALRGAAPREDFVVVKQKFGDEAPALGATSDILFVLGGGPIAAEEMKSALYMGSKIVALTFKTYPQNSAAYLHERHATAKAAFERERLEVIDTKDKLGMFLDTLDIADVQANRELRRDYLNRTLAAS